MERFKAFRLTETPEKKIRAEMVDTTLDQLDAHEITVRVAYSSVNYKDALAATGKGKILRRPSCIGGIDFAGTVVSSSDPRYKKATRSSPRAANTSVCRPTAATRRTAR